MSHDEFADAPVPADVAEEAPSPTEWSMSYGRSPDEGAQYPGEAAGKEPADLDPVSPGRSMPFTSAPELESAVDVLARIAMQMDDPVEALEDGVDALAEALVERQLAAQREEREKQALLRQQESEAIELHNAYRHARLHRIGELIDVGYDMDQAIAITDANEAEVHQRSLAAGRDPRAVIYEYAVRHGYRPGPTRRQDSAEARASSSAAASGRRPTTMERLAELSDEEFAQATEGDRWERLLKAR